MRITPCPKAVQVWFQALGCPKASFWNLIVLTIPLAKCSQNDYFLKYSQTVFNKKSSPPPQKAIRELNSLRLR